MSDKESEEQGGRKRERDSEIGSDSFKGIPSNCCGMTNHGNVPETLQCVDLCHAPLHMTSNLILDLYNWSTPSHDPTPGLMLGLPLSGIPLHYCPKPTIYNKTLEPDHAFPCTTNVEGTTTNTSQTGVSGRTPTRSGLRTAQKTFIFTMSIMENSTHLLTHTSCNHCQFG